MKIVLVIGAAGFLGTRLCPYLSDQGYFVVRAGRSFGLDCVIDPNNYHDILDLILKVEPTHIINLSALANVDMCEDFPEAAFLANTNIPHLISKVINGLENKKPHFVHISSDQVYSGLGPHGEECVLPINVYGLSKFAGELGVDRKISCVLRTNFFGKGVGENNNLCDWLVHSIKRKDNITLFTDVLFNALHMDSLCNVIGMILDKRLTGLYNVGSRGYISKADFGMLLADCLRLDTSNINLGKSTDANFRANRPVDMRMDVKKIENALGIKCPDIIDEIRITSKEYLVE